MLVLLILALSLSITTPSCLLKNTSDLSRTYQQKCLSALPDNPQIQASMSSLLCGEKITDEKLREDLSKTSLIHIFIVSGSHLLLLDQFLSILKIPVFLRFILLGFYSLSVGWQPPAVRALLALILRALFKNLRVYLPSDLIVLACGLFTLLIYPSWWSSMSLQMSWCAALALTLPSALAFKCRSWRRLVYAQALIFLVMTPTLWGWGSLHPLSILYNFLLAPLVSLLLLPWSLVVVFIPISSPTLEAALFIFQKILQACAEPITLPSQESLPSNALWLWIFSLQFLFHFLRLWRKQGRF